MTQSQPEAWLRGPLPDLHAELQPVGHALVQAFEDVERALSTIDSDDVWQRIGAAASAGFHVRHSAGSIDRLLTYARGEQLSAEQRAALAAEQQDAPDIYAAELLRTLHAAIERAFAQLRTTPPTSLDEPRAVGRAALPSTVRGLLHHIGEHTARHAGQVVTTARILQGLRDSARPALSE